MWCCLFACLIHAYFLPHNDLIKTTYRAEVHSFLPFHSVISHFRLFSVQFSQSAWGELLYALCVFLVDDSSGMEKENHLSTYTYDDYLEKIFLLLLYRFFLKPFTAYIHTRFFFIFMSMNMVRYFLILLMEMANIYMSNFCGLKEISFYFCTLPLALKALNNFSASANIMEISFNMNKMVGSTCINKFIKFIT